MHSHYYIICLIILSYMLQLSKLPNCYILSITSYYNEFYLIKFITAYVTPLQCLRFLLTFWPQKLGRSKVGPPQRGHLGNTCDNLELVFNRNWLKFTKVLNYVFPFTFHIMFNFNCWYISKSKSSWSLRYLKSSRASCHRSLGRTWWPSLPLKTRMLDLRPKTQRHIAAQQIIHRGRFLFNKMPRAPRNQPIKVEKLLKQSCADSDFARRPDVRSESQSRDLWIAAFVIYNNIHWAHSPQGFQSH